jgi:tetratricopeptide (TPR) repeat protein
MTETQKIKDAIAGIDKVIALYDEMPESGTEEYSLYIFRMMKGKLLLRTGKEKDAVEWYEKTGFWDILYEYYFDREQYDEALKCRKIQYSDNIDCGQNTKNYGHNEMTPYALFIIHLFSVKKYEVVFDYLETWKSELDYNFYIFMKGNYMERSGMFEEAVACYDYILSHQDSIFDGPREEDEYRYRKGLCLLQLGKIDEGIAAIAEAMNF